jgi:hypothetical protein
VIGSRIVIAPTRIALIGLVVLIAWRLHPGRKGAQDSAPGASGSIDADAH